jgi:flagellar secretion chaperone FliS
MHARAANTYRRVDLDSAPRSQIVDRLFERFAKDTDVARTAIGARDIVGKAAALDHAMQIVTELAASLDHAAAPELCANLSALYDYVSQQLTHANVTLTTEPLDRANRVMAELGAAFKAAHPR